MLFNQNSNATVLTGTDGDYTYEYVADDPLQARIYTLDNGLKVYLTVFKDEPRIQTLIPVKTGSKNDPADATGLAHYLEHMLFKGTDEIGTSNWEEEKVILKEIYDLYEKRRSVTNEAERNKLYKEIDELSYEASTMAIPNEYDKMISALGAKGTNAYTSNDETVYINDIPANQVEKWLKIESERFSQLVLRLFHTELETVYEEFNQSQDRDGFKVFIEQVSNLYPNHPYGTQTTIGEGEHLKNPSMEKIHEYFTTYYVPNNMAICMSGDLDFGETIQLVDKYFGNYETKDVPTFEMPQDIPLTEIVTAEVKGKEAAFMEMAWKFGGSDSRDSKVVQMIDGILSNGQAGLIDLNLNQKQKVLNASSSYWVLNDYTTHFLDATPKEGQSLEEARDLLLGELEKIKKGDFDESLMQAIIKDFKYSEIKQLESNRGRAFAFVDAFTSNTDWTDYVKRFDVLSSVTKDEIVEFANKNYKDNYVLVYKREGEDDSAHKVEKPAITPVEANRDAESPFVTDVNEMAVNGIPAQFLNYDQAITTKKLKNKVPFSYIKNELNETFSLNYIFEMGKNNDKITALAINYLPFLGTSEYSAEDLQRKFFELGLNFGVRAGDDQIRVSLSGLEESLEEGIELFEHILANVEPDKKALDDLVKNILKSREDTKLSKRSIMWGGMMNYAIYGGNSAYTNIISENHLKSIRPNELITKIKNLSSYKHSVFYFGTKPVNTVKKLLNRLHKTNKTLKAYPIKTEYTAVNTDENNVYFVDYDMVQAQLLLVSKEQKYNKELAPYISMFNEYFGSGLSSIVFQEIRETKGLAYSAFCGFNNPSEKDKNHITYAYIGTQADKLPDAFAAMDAIINEMPEAEKQFQAAKKAVLNKIETDRITRSSVFWNYQTAKKRGLDYDIRKDIYNVVKGMTLKDLANFFNENIKGNNYNIMLLSSKDAVDLDYVKTLGNFKELDLEEIFNY